MIREIDPLGAARHLEYNAAQDIIRIMDRMHSSISTAESAPGITAGAACREETTIPQGFFQTLRYALQTYGLRGTIARYLLMKDDFRAFVRRAPDAAAREFRRDLLKRYGIIQSRVVCAHSPYQFVLMAEYILNLKVDGPLVECGCYKGGSTAKLSLLARHLGRKLYVCDSFAGLPDPKDAAEGKLTSLRADIPSYALARGDFLGTIAEVKENIRRYGCLDVCEFVPGFFEASLANLDVAPAFVFTDVDFVSSARTCLRYLWPRLVPGGLWLTHEASYFEYIHGMLDPEFWALTFGECPPLMIGAGSGLALNAASIGYLVKRPKSVQAPPTV